MGGACGTRRAAREEVTKELVEAVQGLRVLDGIVAEPRASEHVLVGDHLKVHFVRDPTSRTRGTWHVARTDDDQRRATFDALLPAAAAILAEARSELSKFTSVPVRHASGLHLTHLPIHPVGNELTDEVVYKKLLETLQSSLSAPTLSA